MHLAQIWCDTVLQRAENVSQGTCERCYLVKGRSTSKALLYCSAVGGNHEASNHLWELYHGGWAAPNIYYLGHAGAINFGGARIAGLSGIYNAKHYRLVSTAHLTHETNFYVKVLVICQPSKHDILQPVHHVCW